MSIQYKLRLRTTSHYRPDPTLQGAVGFAGFLFDLDKAQSEQLARDGVLILKDGSILDIETVDQA